MERGETGRYEITSVGGEQVRAFVPAPLPAAPPLVLEGPLQQALESAVLALGRLDGVSGLRVHEALKSRPILSLPEACRSTGLSYPAASSAMELLTELGIARETTGKRRNRLFVYDGYLATLSEGTEAP